ncbi:MAG TPA: thiamine phosphate synthase [Verrucomicrobiae bacterium]|jgi:thiamine-phosphate pyrophosphorylase
MKPLAQCRLYTFIDTGYLRRRDPVDIAVELCAGGSDLIQLRAKESSGEEILQMARKILPVVRGAGVGLVINDHRDIAEEVGADLYHVGLEDFDPHVPGTPFGLSTHSPQDALLAEKAEPAYIAVGPVYATPTKPSTKPVTLEYVRWAAANVKTPWFAIGGINLENLNDVVSAGAKRICVVSAILNAPDIAEACRQFRKALP